MTDPTRSTPALLRAFRHRNYALFFSGQIVSLIGTWMQSVAQAWLIYRLTRSATLLGAVGFASSIPVFLVASFGGVIADRYDRRRILIFTQSCAMLLALSLAALTLLGHVQVWHIIAFAATLGLVNAFDIPTRQSFVVEMVGREDMTNAIALNSSMVNGARIVGPAVAGIVVASIGEGWCFLANGLSYIAVIAGLLMMRLPKRPPPALKGSPLQRLLEGLRFARQARPIRALLLLLGFISLVGMPYTTLMPIFADQVLGGGATALGTLMGFAGAGALGGSLALASRKGVRGLGRWVAASSISFGVALMLFALSRSFWLSAAVLIGVGASMVVQLASSNTLLQAMVPDEFRGRVMALHSMMFMGMAPFGSLIAGSMASKIGAPSTVAVGGAVAVAGGVFFTTRLPLLRSEVRRMLLENEMVGGRPAEEMVAHRPMQVEVED